MSTEKSNIITSRGVPGSYGDRVIKATTKYRPFI